MICLYRKTVRNTASPQCKVKLMHRITLTYGNILLCTCWDIVCTRNNAVESNGLNTLYEHFYITVFFGVFITVVHSLYAGKVLV
jgi:hypothetical protein